MSKKTLYEIKRCDGTLIVSEEAVSLLEAVQQLVERGVDLRGAYLRGAYLRGADLRGAYLRGAYLNWQSHALLAELLLRAARNDLGRRKMAGLASISTDWYWETFLALDDPLLGWALDTLAAAANPDDPEIPEAVRARMVAGGVRGE